MQCFKQWLIENAMSPMFQLSELSRQFGLTYDVDDGIVYFYGGTGSVADEIRDKCFILGTWEEVYTVPVEVEPTDEELKEIENQETFIDEDNWLDRFKPQKD